MNIPDNDRLEVFTFSNDKDRTEERYDDQCPDGTCVAANRILNDNVGRTGSRSKLALQCDEFPWRSSEQGGKYMDKLDPGRRTRTCVPGYQNNWHGQCFSKSILVAKIQTSLHDCG